MLRKAAAVPITPRTTMDSRFPNCGIVASTLSVALYKLSVLSTQLPAMMIAKAPQPRPMTIMTSRKSSFASTSAAMPPEIITIELTIR